MPIHSEGLIVAYGSDSLMADQFAYRGYIQDVYWKGCGVAAMSPSMLGRIAWIGADGLWVGPCLVVDVVAQHHAYRAVFLLKEIVEVSDVVRKRIGFLNGKVGEVWFGACPPPEGWGESKSYIPPLMFYQGERRPSFNRFAPQEMPRACRGNIN